MSRQFPTDGPLRPHDPPATGLFPRAKELDTIISYVRLDGRAAIWAPRYSGRTSFLYALEDRLQRAEELAVYVSPEDHLNLTSRGTLFQSFAAHIASHLSLSTGEVVEGDDWDRPDALTRFLRSLLTLRDSSRLTIILDDCDKLLSTSLVTLLRFMRSIDTLRNEDQEWKRLAFVVAGAVSFRNLKLLESSELSPFEKWKPFRLGDLTPDEARDYLCKAFVELRIHVEPEVVAAVVDFAGGEVRFLNSFGHAMCEYQSTSILIDGAAVQKIVKEFLADYGSDPAIAYMLSVIAHDPRCLEVVNRLLSNPDQEQTSFVTGDLYADQIQHFEMSNQELSGGLILGRGSNASQQWLIRSRFRGEVLRRHFTTRRLARALLDLGQYSRAESIVRNRLANELEKDFREEVLSFDEAAVRDVIEWFWGFGGAASGLPPKAGGAIRSVDRVLAGFEALTFVLERIFGIEAFTVYEIDLGSRQLVANDLLPGERSSHRSLISLDMGGQQSPAQEVRAYTAKVYTVEIEEHAWLMISIPLKNTAGEVTGVLSFRTERFLKEDWATLFVRVPIIERAVCSIWRLLTRFERDQYKGLFGVVPLISVQFDTGSYQYFKKNIQRFPPSLPARLLEFTRGIVFNEIIKAMKSLGSLLIFDLSHINSNVFFELGLAIGLNRPGLPVRDAKRRLDLGPLDGLIRETYQSGTILGEVFFDQLRERWASYQAQILRENFVHLLNDEIPATADAFVERPFVLVIDHNRYQDSREYRRGVERATKRAGVEDVVYIWEGGVRDGRFTRHARGQDDTLLLSMYKLIQMAAAVVARIEKIQDEEHYALRFLATGIAMGLGKRSGHENVILTARSFSDDHRAIAVPSDFEGCEPIEFEKEKLTDFVNDIASDLMHKVAQRAGSVRQLGLL